MRLRFALIFLFSLMMFGSFSAYYNITFVNTTIVLNSNTSGHVVEVFTLYVSNSSLQQYQTDRDAVGLSLSDWQKILYNSGLNQHIISSTHSTSNFEFLPGPLVINQYNAGQALLTMSYDINNITSVVPIAPRKFEYTFNSSVFNFESTASGQVLPNDQRLNLIIPSGTQALSIYPLPDNPSPTFLGNYTNFTRFSWFSGEPLSQFTFTFIAQQSLQAEVVAYLTAVYSQYNLLIYIIILGAIAFILAYVYFRSGKEKA